MHPMFVELFLAEDADEPAGERDKRRAASRARRARVLVRRGPVASGVRPGNLVRPGESRGPHVCELVPSLPDASAL